ncbi:MAG: bifunctional phosphopantothenoylcysteine decarboxylase/phosphopantothenate--cysteine ligase CoaBC [Pseudomonadota bacterium]
MTDTSRASLILGITGGVAAYKAAELARLWVKAGHAVQVVMTEAATHFIGTATLQALTGRPVLTELWGSAPSPRPLPRRGEGGKDEMPVLDGMDHIHASRQADLIVVAPASADFMAKLAQGRADDLLSTLCLARACPLMLAPAMNREMWANPATQRNLAQLIEDGVHIVGPESGEQACGETGLGRMSEPQAIFDAVEAFLFGGALAGKKVLITAGPTYEPIDPVRGITNLSSGKMGYALAAAAREAGAEVILVSGPSALATPAGVTRVNVTTADEMYDAVMERIAGQDVFISVAAVADYRPAEAAVQKIKKSGQPLALKLLPNEDILAGVAALPKAPFCVGFAAETEKLMEHAEAKRQKKRLPMLVANLAQHTLGADRAELVVLDDKGSHPLPAADKLTQARRIVAHLAQFLD